MGTVDERIFHENIDLVAQQLLVIVPDNGIEIHRHTGIEGIVDQRIADGLHINTIGTNMMIGVDLTVYGVSLDIKSDNLQGVSMHK